PGGLARRKPARQGAGGAVAAPAARVHAGLERTADRAAVPRHHGAAGGAPGMKRKSIAGPLIASIIFIAITATVTAVLGISIAHTGVSATVGYHAVFSDVTGLIPGDDVDIAGVRVCQV